MVQIRRKNRHNGFMDATVKEPMLPEWPAIEVLEGSALKLVESASG